MDFEVSFYSLLVSFFLNQVWCGPGHLDVSSRQTDISSGEAADFLHQFRDVSVGREPQHYAEAGLGRHPQENDHNQVRRAKVKF